MRKIINVTGTIIHTNFGRSLLSREAIENVEMVCSNYVNVEYDLDSGSRGHRDKLTEGLIKELTGCEAATVVNNNAAAVWLCLNTLARGKEVIVSRGELVEIGGSFRLPEVMENSGAKLREVGTTNRTYIDDYKEAISENTGMLLKAHTSNYRIEGSVWNIGIDELVSLGREYNLIVMEDLGSGALVDLSKYGLPREPLVKDSISAGIDLVTFSGDKLLGGPQGGIIAGRKDLIERIRNNPIMRCVRVGKIIIAALEATLRLYTNGMEGNIPSLAFLMRPIQDIHTVAERICSKLEGILKSIALVSIEYGMSQVGSGALPVESIESVYIALKPVSLSVDRLSALFRSCEVPVIGRIWEGRFLMDMRTIDEGNEEYIIKAAELVRKSSGE